MKKSVIIPVMMLLAQLGASAQQTLTLENCRQMAVSGNDDLEQARQKVKMAEYDKKIAIANYFPNISAKGAYMYNSRDIKLVSDEQTAALSGLGTTVQQQLGTQVQTLMQAIRTSPTLGAEYMNSGMWQTVLGAMSQMDVSTALNAIGSSVAESFDLDISNMFVGAVSLQQPLFVGGKIIASNKMAELALELSRNQYDSKYQDILINVDKAYWQIVSLANKKKLAQDYADLLEKMEKDAEVAVAEGVAVQSDLLTIKVKRSEADMMLSRATNGLALSKMLLCKEIGMPLDSEITLADETLDDIPMPSLLGQKDMNQVYQDRPETKSLNLASQIYDQKVNIARADMMPKIALTANYIVSNPSCFNGFENKFGGMFNAGVVVSVPIFHATEALQKTRKAKAEATIYRSQYDNACKMISLQVEQLSRQQSEALERVQMLKETLDSAEENLRVAMVGFEEGVVTTDVTLQAQTAWVKAHSEYIDAEVDLQVNHSELLKAQGEFSVPANEK